VAGGHCPSTGQNRGGRERRRVKEERERVRVRVPINFSQKFAGKL
jgi:hypothetical protein